MSELMQMADTASSTPPPVDRKVGAYAGYVDGRYVIVPDAAAHLPPALQQSPNNV
jgi:hypothetical protein